MGDPDRGVEVALRDVVEELRNVALAVLLGAAQCEALVRDAIGNLSVSFQSPVSRSS